MGDIIGVVMPHRNNIIGVVYEKDGQIYMAEPIANLTSKKTSDLNNKSNDHLIRSIEDIKKVYTIKQLKGPVVHRIEH